MLEPILKKVASHCSVILQRGQDFPSTLGGHHANPLEPLPADCAVDSLTSRCTGVFTVQKLIYAGFIDIG